MPSLPQTTRNGQSENDWEERLRPNQQGNLRMNTRRASAPFRMPRMHLLGDQFDQQQGVRVPVSKARFRTMDALLDQLNESIPLPFGVRRLHTPYGMSEVSSLDDLKPHGQYIVASGSRQVRGVDLEAVERRRRRREAAQRRWNFQQGVSLSSSFQHEQIDQQQQEQEEGTTSAYPDQQRLGNNNNNNRTTTTTFTMDTERTNVTKPAQQQPQLPKLDPFVPITFKPVFFVLNGHPHRVYRALINPTRKAPLDHLLEEVSNGLKAAIFRLYSFDGDRILSIDQLLQLKDMRAVAVPRHEQLALNGTFAPHSSIIRPAVRPPVELLVNASAASFTALPTLHRNSKKTSRSSKSSSGASSTNNANEVDGKEKPTISSSLYRQTVARTATSAVTADSDSGRPRTELDNEPTGEQELEKKRTFVDEEENDDEEEEEEDDDYPEEPEELRALRETEEEERRKRKRGSKKKKSKVMKIEEREKEGKGREDEAGKEEKRHKEHDDTEEEEEEEVQKGQSEVEEEGKRSQKEEEKEEEGKETEDDERQQERDVDGLMDVALEDDAQNDADKKTDQKMEKNDDATMEYGQKNGEAVREREENGTGQAAVNEHQKDGVSKAVDEQKDNGAGQAVDELVQQNHGTSTQHQQFGVYTSELEQILYGEAAVKIQSAWRGYSTRKELKKRRNLGEQTAPPMVMINGGGTALAYHQRHDTRPRKTDMYKTNAHHLAAVNTVKPITFSQDAILDSSSEREEGTHGTEYLMERKNGKAVGWETADAPQLPGQDAQPGAEFRYTVTVITGNRWAADTEADLYIVMHGPEFDSGRLWLKQEFTNWLHNTSPNGPRFRQNQSDSFAFRLPSRLGIIDRLTVGHERRGYGAGVFIDRILVTEDEEAAETHGDENGQGMPTMVEEEQQYAVDCRQFLFLCNRWFDSGQVDGKLERNIRLSAFYMINTIPVDGRVTRGRWEFVLHGGTADGRGGTSSQLAITGYGTAGQSTTNGLYDSRLANAPSEALMQVDFGDIGELLKIRVELDEGEGTSPDYFLNFVEFKDLDTDEHFVVMCGKWLRWRSVKKSDQPFRELIAFHIGVEPLPLITYEGKIRAFRSPLSCLRDEQIRVQLYGDLGDTGHVLVPLIIATGEEENTAAIKSSILPHGRDTENADAVRWADIPFRVEAVSVGRVGGARVHFVLNMEGEQIFEGLLTLQHIFKKQSVWPLSANSSFVISNVRLTESAHTPYRYVLNRSQLGERRGDQQTNALLVKELLTTEMEGISTRLPSRKSHSKKVPRKWLLQMTLSEGSTILPDVFLCWEERALAMTPLGPSLSDGILSYRLLNNSTGFEPFVKVRISAGTQTLLGASNSAQNVANKVGTTSNNEMPFTFVEKVRICDPANGDELRFPSADCMLERHCVFELPVVWPDRSPVPVLVYSVRIATGPTTDPSNPELIVRLNLFGEHGDVGHRTLIRDDQQKMVVASDHNHKQEGIMPLFAPKTSCSFEFEAVSIGDIRSAEVAVHTVPKDANFCWECAEVVITDFSGRSAPFYAFKFPSPFNAQCSVQSANVLPFTDAL